MARRFYSNTATEASLTTGISSADTSFTLTSFAGYPSAPFYATIGRGEADEEIVLVTTVSSSTVTCTRGADGTTAKSHAAGATFLHTAVAKDFDDASAHINADTGVHGLAGQVVGTSDVQTLTNKTLTSPVLASPTSTGTHAHASGTFSGTLSVTGVTSLSSLTVSGTSTLGAVTASGLITANGSITVPTGKIVTITDAPAAGTSGVNKTYADARETAAKAYTDTRETAIKSYADTQDATNLTAAKAYTDGKFTAPSKTALNINGHASFSADATSPPGYRKYSDGLVVLEGSINVANQSYPLGQTVCTLPVGARPGVNISFVGAGPGPGAAWRIDVFTTGVIAYGAGIGTTGSPSSMSLVGSFHAVN